MRRPGRQCHENTVAPTLVREDELDPEDLLLLRLELLLGDEALPQQRRVLLDLGRVVVGRGGGRGGRSDCLLLLRGRHTLFVGSLLSLLLTGGLLICPLRAHVGRPAHHDRRPNDSHTSASHHLSSPLALSLRPWRLPAPTRALPGRRRAESARRRSALHPRRASPGRRCAPTRSPRSGAPPRCSARVPLPRL